MSGDKRNYNLSHSAMLTAAAAAMAGIAWITWSRTRKRMKEDQIWKQSLKERNFEHPRNSATDMRVVSYNVLADGPKYGMNPNAQYIVSREYIEGSYRFNKILEEIKSYDATVLALQETQDRTLEQYFRPALGDEYVELHNERLTEEEEQGQSQRNPFHKNTDCLFVRQKECDVLATSVVPYRSMVSSVKPSGSLTNGDEKLWQLLEDRYDGVSLAIVRYSASGKYACIGNTHLYYNPRSPEIKTMQAYLMVHAAVDFCRKSKFHPEGSSYESAEEREWPTIPLIMCGDYNILFEKPHLDQFDVATEEEWKSGSRYTRRSGAYNLLTTGELSYQHQEHPYRRGAELMKENLRLPVGAMKSAYVDGLGEELPLTTRVIGFEGTLDYIFVSRSVRVSQVLPMPYNTVETDYGKNASEDFRPCPNDIWPSDHLAIGVDLSLT